MRYKNKCVVKAQKMIRGYLARRQHRPRYKGIIKINALRRNVKEMETITNQLRGERDSMLKQLRDIDQQIDIAIKKIKVCAFMLVHAASFNR
jgi:myosin-6